MGFLRTAHCDCTLQPTCPAETSTSYPATCSSYRTKWTLWPALRSIYTAECSLQIQHGDFQIATKYTPQRTGKAGDVYGIDWSLLPRTPRYFSSRAERFALQLQYLESRSPNNILQSLNLSEDSHRSIRLARALLGTFMLPQKHLRFHLLIL